MSLTSTATSFDDGVQMRTLTWVNQIAQELYPVEYDDMYRFIAYGHAYYRMTNSVIAFTHQVGYEREDTLYTLDHTIWARRFSGGGFPGVADQGYGEKYQGQNDFVVPSTALLSPGILVPPRSRLLFDWSTGSGQIIYQFGIFEGSDLDVLLKYM